MARKFKDEQPQGEYGGIDRGIDLAGYIRQFAPDILCAIPVMLGDSALYFWTQLFQEPQLQEAKRAVKSSIDWPYANRLIFSARRFKALNDREQHYISKAAKAAIWWRGDELTHFRLIVEETLDYRQLNNNAQSNYRKQILVVAKTLATRHADVAA